MEQESEVGAKGAFCSGWRIEPVHVVGGCRKPLLDERTEHHVSRYLIIISFKKEQ